MQVGKIRRRIAAPLFAGITLLAFTGVAFGDEAEDARIEQGRIIFEETAGDVGCAACHGMSATGDQDAGGPYIRGASKAQLDSALGGGVPIMGFIKLSLEEKAAVLSYLSYLTRAEEVTLDPVALAGKKIFEETAGGVGCSSCHGEKAEGDIGPAIHGQDAVAILEQLKTNEAMSFIELTPEEVDQVAAYLRYLHDTEAH
jgi:mono/diheme cytochrome c family protein